MRSIWPGTVLGVGLVVGSAGLLRGSEPRGTEPASLVERLGSPKFSDREEASEAIREIGTEALDQLKQARESDDPEVRARSLRLLEAIEREAALEPSMVRMPKVPADLQEVVRRLDEQTEFPLKTSSDGPLEPDRAGKAGERVTFWQAVDRLGLEPTWTRIDPFRILELPVERPRLRLEGSSGSPSSTWSDGPFRVSVKEGRSTLQERFGRPADPSRITLDLSVDVEPKLTLSGRPMVTLTEAVDSEGQSLLLDGLTRFSPISDDDLELTTMHVEATLGRRDRQSRKIARIKGVVELEVEAPSSEPVELPLDAKAAMRSVDLDGLRITLMDVRIEPVSRSMWLDLLFEPSDWADTFRNQGFRRRRDVRNMVRIRLLERLMIVDSRGNPVPRVRTRSLRTSRVGLEVKLYSNPTIDEPLPEKLLIANPLRIPVKLEFDFKDVAVKPVSP